MNRLFNWTLTTRRGCYSHALSARSHQLYPIANLSDYHSVEQAEYFNSQYSKGTWPSKWDTKVVTIARSKET